MYGGSQEKNLKALLSGEALRKAYESPNKFLDVYKRQFYNSTPDRKKLENCILVAANAFRLYKHYKSTA